MMKKLLPAIITMLLASIFIAANQTGQPNEKNITLTLEYGDSPLFDPDNDGLESPNGIIDLTIKNSAFSWDVKENHLCAVWEIHNISVCKGSLQCCNFLELPASGDWNEDFFAYRRTDSVSSSANVSAQILYID